MSSVTTVRSASAVRSSEGWLGRFYNTPPRTDGGITPKV
nr:MAG TPA: hypothetical protein [Crassvirales sp.]